MYVDVLLPNESLNLGSEDYINQEPALPNMGCQEPADTVFMLIVVIVHLLVHRFLVQHAVGVEGSHFYRHLPSTGYSEAIGQEIGSGRCSDHR